MNYLLDTHTWIWWNIRPAALSKKVRQTIQEGAYEELLISAISVWELSKLIEKKRLKFSCDGKQWIDQALDMPRLRLIPLSPEIAWQSSTLPRPFHDDPADQIIVASARMEGATILTIDRLIQGYPHVRSLW
jgi:PIN domain nuclease of toxin-antitoxin system